MLQINSILKPPSESSLTFSVGTQLSGSGYLTKNDNGDNVTITITHNGVATFSHPQTHPYVGIGDKIITAGNTFYISQKMDDFKWKLSNATGGAPSRVSNVLVTSINKTFASLNEALDGTNSGAKALIGTSDLITMGLDDPQGLGVLRIALYAMTDTIGDGVWITGWDTDDKNFIRIYTPCDLRNDCNSSQRHGGILGQGYTLDLNTANDSINLSQAYTEVYGIGIDDSGHVTGIRTLAEKCKVVHNVIKGGYESSINSSEQAYVVGNILYDSPIGILDTVSDDGIIINNTIVDCGIGISGGVNTESWNNLIQGTTTGITGLNPLNIHGTYTDDATAGTNDLSLSNVFIIFRDYTNDDFHLDFASSITAANPITQGKSSVTSIFDFDRDIDNELMGGTGWPIGADRFVPSAIFSVGKDTADIKTGSPYVTITSGIMTFLDSLGTSSVNQTNSTLCSGCVVLVGGISYYLYKKISDNSWMVTTSSGLAPYSIALTIVTSIKYTFTSLIVASAAISGLNLVSLNLRIFLACTQGYHYDGFNTSSLGVDENHYLKIYAPGNVGVDCNTSRRHSGVLNPNLFIINDISIASNNTVGITNSYTKIEGIQISGDKIGINVISGTNISITDNIIYKTKDDSVKFDNISTGGVNIIANNTIYSSLRSGIVIMHNDYTTYGQRNTFCIYNNTINKCYEGVYLDIDEAAAENNLILFYNNLIQNSTLRDCFSTSGTSRFLKSRSNYCSDRSIIDFNGINDVNSFDAEFKDEFNDDLRLAFCDSASMTSALDLGSDHLYQLINDSTGSPRSRYKMDAGANSWKPDTTKEIHYSIGSSSSARYTGDISITDNVLTFDSDIVQSIGVGDVLSYSNPGSVKCYLAEKGNDKKWLVRSVDGSLSVADTNGPVPSLLRRVSNSIRAAFDPSGPNEFASILGSTNLVSQNIATLFAWCYNDDSIDDGNVAIQGWTTSSNNKIKIQAPWNIKTQCGESNRHTSYWGGQGFTIESTNSKCVEVNNDNVIIDGLKIKPLTGNKAVVIGEYENCVVSRNIIKEATVGIESASLTKINCAFGNLIYDTTVSSLLMNTGYVFSNTLVGTAGNGIVSTSNTAVINNISVGFATCISGTPGLSKSNITSDATAGSSLGNKSSITDINFKDVLLKDYRLRRDDLIAFNTGSNLSNNKYYSFNSGIDLVEANSSWSIGADITPDFDDVDLYFSVGRDISDLKESALTSVVITNGIAYFSEDQNNPGIGIGDTLTHSSGVCYLFSKLTNSSWEVKTKYGLTPSDISSSSVTSITHTFEHLSDAVYSGIKELIGSVANPFFNFVSSKYRIHLALYKSSEFYQEDKVHIRDYTTSSDYYLRVYSPHDTSKECNSRQRHDGYADTTIPVESDLSLIYLEGDPGESILVESDNITIDGIITTCKNNQALNTGIKLNQCYGSKIVGNIINRYNNGILNNPGDHVYDNFYGSIGSQWHSDFTTNWYLRSVSDDNYVATQGAIATHRLTKDIQVDFDFEFGIYVDEIPSGNDYLKIGVFGAPDNLQKLEIGYQVDGVGDHCIAINGANFIKAKDVSGKIYRMKLTRGRIVTSDGVLANPSDDIFRLYYFDDFGSEDSGSNTGKWAAHPYTIPTAYNQPIYMKITSTGRHGLDYLKVWSQAGAFNVDQLEGPYSLSRAFIVNNIVDDCLVDGIKTSGNDIVYNNTVYDANNYGYNNKSSDVLLNNIYRRSSGGPGGYANNTTIGNCISNEATVNALSTNFNQIHTLSFTNVSEHNFNISFGDLPARGRGRKLINDYYFSFDYDAAMKKRDRLWDIGALEYVVEKKVCYSVGKYPNDFATRKNGVVTYSISIDSVMTFSVPQIDARMGIGNVVEDYNSSNLPNGCVILEKIDQSNWIVTDITGASISPVSNGLVQSIKRYSSDLGECLDNYFGVFSRAIGSQDLTNIRTRVLIACYDDNDYGWGDYDCIISSITSDADYFVRVFAPNDIEKEVNESQRHSGKIGLSKGNGFLLKPIEPERYSTTYGYLYIESSDYTEIEGLAISGVSQKIDCINSTLSKNVFISSNIMAGDANGININIGENGSKFDKEVVINNVVYNCDGDGIIVGSYLNIDDSRSVIYNNTVYHCYVGIKIKHSPNGNTIKAYLKNNVVQDSTVVDYFIENVGNTTPSIRVMQNNLSEDYSLGLVSSYIDHNIPYVKLQFSNELQKYFAFERSQGFVIDSGIDLTEDYYYPFSTDIVGVTRKLEAWDIGAFELQDADGFSSLVIGPMITHGRGFASNLEQYADLYLRESVGDYLNSIDLAFQFLTINDLNTFLDSNSSIYNKLNITIHVQGNSIFSGSFSFNDKSNKRVIVKTYDDEADLGPASIVYTNPLIDDSSITSFVEFRNIKVYSDDNLTSPNIVSNSYSGSIIKFVNSIVQVNSDCIVDSSSCLIESYNSMIIYLNDSVSANLFLVKNSMPGSLCYNSIIIAVRALSMTFGTTNVISNDNVINCLGYNYLGSISFSNSPTKILNSKNNLDPLFVDSPFLTLTDPSDVMSRTFVPYISSPCVDSGNNLYVQTTEDILGNNRISSVVDIGPYEIEVNNFNFKSEDIIMVFQDKLSLDFSTKNCRSSLGDVVYKDLYDQFFGTPAKSVEFLRESKVIFKMKDSFSEKIFYNDKKMIEIARFEAYYDSGTKSIVVSKDQKKTDEIFKNIFKDGRYNFYFNEVKHYLVIYLNETYEKGLSGSGNPVRNVKFGGHSVMSN